LGWVPPLKDIKGIILDWHGWKRELRPN
jgi:hypothetical protein